MMAQRKEVEGKERERERYQCLISSWSTKIWWWWVMMKWRTADWRGISKTLLSFPPIIEGPKSSERLSAVILFTSWLEATLEKRKKNKLRNEVKPERTEEKKKGLLLQVANNVLDRVQRGFGEFGERRLHFFHLLVLERQLFRESARLQVLPFCFVKKRVRIDGVRVGGTRKNIY